MADAKIGASAHVHGGSMWAMVLLLAAHVSPLAAGAQQPVHEKGAALFQSAGCAHCHGADAHGTERAPSLAGCGKRWHSSEIEKQIRDGGKVMPAFGESLTRAEVRALVKYVKQVQ